MPIYQLTNELVFPHPENATEDGILAVGGDLSLLRLVLAYRNGIFPWYNEGDPIIWWSPNPRCVLYTHKLKVSKSMKTLINRGVFQVTWNKCFKEVISACKKAPRKGQDGTWIDVDMQKAYTNLHENGFAHSIEVWREEKLVGGLYGLLIGRCFFGESMFSAESNASKYGLIKLGEALQKEGVEMIDCQTTTKHLLSMGAEEIDRNEFLEYLDQNCFEQEGISNWRLIRKHFDKQ